MEIKCIKIIDIWINKIQNYGWKIEDAPNEEIRKELERINNIKL